jgi:hypothetical protein
METLSAWLLRWLRVPPEPHLPAGDPSTARVFRAAENYWRLKLGLWIARQISGLGALIFATVLLRSASWFQALAEGTFDPKAGGFVAISILLFRIFEPMAWVVFWIQLPFSYQLARLEYELRWYIVTDRAARLREGIWSLNEMTLTLANVQDISIKQGPLQRLLGIADVELRTAGGSDPAAGAGKHHGGGPNLHLAKFKAVDNAEMIRDLVRERMRHARGAGLGDPEDHHHDDAPSTVPVPASSAALEQALRQVREQSRLLRQAAERIP